MCEFEEVRGPFFPDNCPRALASSLQRCWNPDPTERPTDFYEIRSELRKLKANLLTSAVDSADQGATAEARQQESDSRQDQEKGSVISSSRSRRLNALVLGDSELVENIISRICGAARRHKDHVGRLTESRNSRPPLCLYGDAKGINRDNFTDIKTFVKARYEWWHRKHVMALWADALRRHYGKRPALLPDSTSRLHVVLFVCKKFSDLPDRFEWSEITGELHDLPVQILVISEVLANQGMDFNYNKILKHRRGFFPNAQNLDEHIVEVALTDGGLKDKLWRVCWAAKTRCEIENAAKIIRTIRKELGSAGASSLYRSEKFVFQFLCAYWDVPPDSLYCVRFDQPDDIKRHRRVKFCLQVAAVILYIRSANQTQYVDSKDFVPEASSQSLYEQAQECFDRYFPSSVRRSYYDKMGSNDMRELLQSFFERKPRPLLSHTHRNFGFKCTPWGGVRSQSEPKRWGEFQHIIDLFLGEFMLKTRVARTKCRMMP